MQNDIQNQIDLLQHGFVSTVLNSSGGIFNNGKVAIAKDLIFGLTVWNGEVWWPLSDCTYAELVEVRGLIDGSTTFLWNDQLNEVIKSAIDREAQNA